MKKRKNGYTIIEILAVILIIGLLLAIAVPAVNKQLNDFRVNYYEKLEESIKAGGQDYISDKRFSKPKDLLYSKVITLKELEDAKYIDEVVDYVGKSCDVENSYVVVVKTSEKDYEYHTCLKCSYDEYETNTTKEKNDYCNEAWLTNEYVDYERDTIGSELFYVYYGTKEEKIKEQVGMQYNVVKRDSEGNLLASVSVGNSEDDILYPENIGQLVGANVNTIVDLKYVLPNGDTLTKKAVIYEHNAPIIETVYEKDNIITGKKSGDSYKYNVGEWAGKLKISISFSNDDIEEILNNVKISGAEYYDSGSKQWVDTNCVVKDNRTCEWTINKDFNKNVKLRVVNENGEKGAASTEYLLQVDTTAPYCVINDGDSVWVKSRTVNQVCGDYLSGCGQNTFSKTYPTNDVSNKKIDDIFIYDKAGNKTSCSANFYVDSTPPSSCVVTIKNSSGSVVSSGSTSTKDVTFSVKGEDKETDASGIKSEVWVVNYGTTNKGQLSGTSGLDNGSYSVIGTCTDNAGNIKTSATSTVTLDKSITIKYNINNGTSGSMDDTVCKYNTACTLTKNAFTREGYTFDGWNTKADGTGTNYSDSASVTLKSDVTLYAKWKANSYTITYYVGNGSSTAGATKLGTSTCTYNSSCTLKSFSTLGGKFPYSGADSSQTDYRWTFYGWGTSKSDTSRNYTDSDTFTYTSSSGISLYAIGRKAFYFNTGIAPTASFKTEYQYWNPYSTATSYLTSITIPKQTNISGWTFIGYRGGSSSASSTVTFASSTTGTSQTPTYDTWGTNRSVYSRTVYVAYSGNGSTSGSTANTSATQYYSSGYGSSGANNGANVSTPKFTLAKNGFSKTGHTFSTWAEGSTSGTQYAAGASYSNFTPSVSSTGTTKTMYAIWKASNCTIVYDKNNSSTVSNVPATQSVNVGSTIYISNAIPSTSNKGFTGWKYGNTTYAPGSSMGTCNGGTYTLTAQWNSSIGTYPDVKVNIGDTTAKDYAYTNGSWGLKAVTTLNYQNQTSSHNVCELKLTDYSNKTITSSYGVFKLKVYVYMSSGSKNYQVQWCTGMDPSTQCRSGDIADFIGTDGSYTENGTTYKKINGYWGTSGTSLGHQVTYGHGISDYFRMRGKNGSTYSNWTPIYSSNWNTTSSANFTSYCQ